MKHLGCRVVISLAVAGFLVAGCTEGSADPKPTGPESSAVEPSTVASPLQPSPTVAVSAPATISDLFPGDRAVSVATFWEANPGMGPDYLGRATLLLDVEGAGAQAVDLDVSEEEAAYALILTCDAAVPYRVSLLDRNGAELSWTGGESCGGPELGSYLTAPLATTPVSVVVDVPEGTKTALVAYSVRP
ncbi:MAG: hypothetical protein QM705_01895 [Ancrocorticia sp.]